MRLFLGKRIHRGTLTEVFVGAGLFCAFAVYHPEIIGAFIFATGQSDCPLDLTINGPRVKLRQEQGRKRLVEASRLMTHDAGAGLELWHTPEGEWWIPAGGDWEMFHQLAEQRRGIYERNGRGVVPGGTVLDCGANIGLYAKHALLNGAGKVVAIEPAPVNLECLRRNLFREIADGRVLVVEKGVWHKEDTLDLKVNDENTGAHSLVVTPEKFHSVKVPLTTIDKLVRDLKLDRVDFIKMDIEGAERRALEGAMETIGKFHPRMALCVYHLLDDAQVIPALARKGWNGYRETCGPCLNTGWSMPREVMFFF